MSSSKPRVSTRAKYKIRFSPYLWVGRLDMANPTLHAITETIANVVDPDGGHCWLAYRTIAERSKHVSVSAVEKAVATLVKHKVVRKIDGQERLDILDRANASYNPHQPPLVLELLIPASAYAPDDLDRVNLMRADRGMDPITYTSRPDITGLIGELPKTRSDKGKKSPARSPKDRRQQAAEFAAQQPSLYDAQNLAGPPEDPLHDPPPSLRGGDPPLSEGGTPLSQRYNPYGVNPYDADPGLPSVARDVQVEAFAQVSDSDGADGQEVARQSEDRAVKDAGGDAPRPAEDPDPAPAESPVPAAGTPVPSSPAELVVDSLLRETAQMGATPLTDPVGDRGRLVAMAQSALEGGLSPSRLREITSAGLHNVRRQWALATRLAAPQAFASVRQGAFGGSPLGGGPVPRQGPLCVLHPRCTITVAPNNRCAECVEAERLAALAREEITEYTLGTDGLWRDHTGTPATDADEFEGLSEDQVAKELAVRERMRQELAAAAERSRGHAAAARRMLRDLRSETT